MEASKNIIVLLILLHLVNSQLIKPNSVYENIIKSIYEYYRSDCVIIFYAPSKLTSVEDIETRTTLKELFTFFIKNLIQTTITDIQKFINQVNFNNINRSIRNTLFVFLDDSDKLKNQLVTLLAPLIDVSQPTWLIFFSDATNINNFFADFYIPFDCRFMVSQKNMYNDDETITEIYQIDKNKELMQNVFGRWNLGTGMQLPTLSLYERRKDLRGHTMRVVSLKSEPYSIIHVDKHKKLTLRGIFGSITTLLQQRMNFTPSYSIVSEYGVGLDNGTWTGGVGNLIRNISDLFSTSVRMNSARFRVIQFSAPLYLIRDNFYFKKPLSTLSWEIFLTPFDQIIWMILVILMIVTGVTIDLILLFYMRENLQSQMKMRSLKATEVFLDVFGALCNQGMPKSEINSVNVVQLTIHLTATIVLAAYSGILTSSLTINTFVAPFSTMQGVLQDKSYRMGILGNSAYHDYFKNTADAVMKEVFRRKILSETSLPSTFTDGLARVCTENKYAFLAPNHSAAPFRMKNCVLLVIASDAVFRSSIAIGLPRNSPFRGLINYHINSLRESGVLQKISDDWTKGPPVEQEDEAKTVEFYTILSLLTILVGSCILSVLFLKAERILYRKLLRRKQIAMWQRLNIKILKH